ncbi:MAG: hypothetical protein M9932_01580 [Xanthobacteraceae bacterium]|nr:hypothetical protein [Xanthobacteraceae bacterium]
MENIKPPAGVVSGVSKLAPIIVIVHPLPSKPGRYSASIGDRVVIASAREPFLPAARVLLSEGTPPETLIVMRHAGSSIDALRSTVGKAAGLTVRETETSGPRLETYRSRWDSFTRHSDAHAFKLSVGSQVAADAEAPTHKDGGAQ